MAQNKMTQVAAANNFDKLLGKIETIERQNNRAEIVEDEE